MTVREKILLTRSHLARQKSELKGYFYAYKSAITSIKDGTTGGSGQDAIVHNGFCSQTKSRANQNDLESAFKKVTAEINAETLIGDWSCVSQNLIAQFASITQDRQWIHVDVERAAKESPYRSTVAHGLLILALIPTLTAGRDLKKLIGLRPRMVINLGLNEVRFITPLKAGAYVRARTNIVRVEIVKNGLDVTEEVKIEAKSSKIVCASQTVYRVIL